MAADWTDSENDAIVIAYFDMLRADLAGHGVNKAATYRALSGAGPRSAKSVERKFMNVSAVLEAIGETWVTGLMPARNYQRSLEDAVARYLTDHQVEDLPDPPQPHLYEAPDLFLAPPPTLSNRPPPPELDRMRATATRFDAVARDAANRALGRRGEALVFAHERRRLRTTRPDLADRVVWTAHDEGDGAGYDVASFNDDGSPRLIEVKATNGGVWTPFHITRNEVAVAEARAQEWSLVRLYDMRRHVRAYELRPPLSAHVALTPESYTARLA